MEYWEKIAGWDHCDEGVVVVANGADEVVILYIGVITQGADKYGRGDAGLGGVERWWW